MTTMTISEVRFSLASHLADDDKPSLAMMRVWLASIDAHLAKDAQVPDELCAFPQDAAGRQAT